MIFCNSVHAYILVIKWLAITWVNNNYVNESSVVTMANASVSSALGMLLTSKRLLFFFNIPFTLLNTSSRGFRSGEYRGRNSRRTPTWSTIISEMACTWWMDALSRIRTEWGFVQLKGCKTGKRQFHTNVSKTSPFTFPSARYRSWIPSRDITSIAEYRVPRTMRQWSCGVLPHTL